MGPLIPVFWTSDDISGFQSQSGQPYSHLVEAYMLHIPEIYPWCDTCQPLGSQHDSHCVLFHVPVSKHVEAMLVSSTPGITWDRNLLHVELFDLKGIHDFGDNEIQPIVALDF